MLNLGQNLSDMDQQQKKLSGQIIPYQKSHIFISVHSRNSWVFDPHTLPNTHILNLVRDIPRHNWTIVT